MRLWKLLGVAGIAGVAATGAVLARDERQRRAYTPDDVRARLRERAEAAGEEPEAVLVVPRATTRLGRLRRRAGWQARKLPAVTPFRQLERRLNRDVRPRPTVFEGNAVDGPA